jgi:hypothetical protein
MESSTSVLRGLDFLFGDLEPGAEASWTVSVDVPTAASSRIDSWRVYLVDDRGAMGSPFSGTVRTQGLTRPSFEVRLRTTNEKQTDGSSLLKVKTQVRNVGPGDAGEVQLHFGSPSDESVERLERWASISSLPSGEEGLAELNLRVRDSARLPQIEIRLRVRDRVTQAATTVALKLPSQGKPHDTGWLVPPEVSLLQPSTRASDSTVTPREEVTIIGSASAKDGLEHVEVFLGRDKIFVLPAESGSSGRRERVEIQAESVLRVGPNRVRVKARSTKGVEVSQSTWVLGGSAAGED